MAAERADGQGGFTLLEVLIAFVIAALAIGVLFHGTIAGLESTAIAGRYDEAISLARSHLAPIGRGAGIAPQVTSGADGDGFTWHLRIRALASRTLTLSEQDRANHVPASRAVLYDIVVTESWRAGGRQRQVSIATRRLSVQAGEG